MPRRFFKKYFPSHETVRQNRHIARFGSFLQHPNLWHLNRHSVAGGVGIGLFAGLVPGPLQMVTAALLAVPLRVNLPIALAMTLYTNPFTIGPLYLLAYKIGALIVDGPGHSLAPPDFDWTAFSASIKLFVAWMLSLGKPLFIGLLVLAIGLGLLGYAGVQVGWRAYVIRKWRQRGQLRRSRANAPAHT